MNNYSNLLLKSNENEKELKKKINEGRNNLKQIKSQLEKERLEYENKINLMQGQIKNLKDEKLSKKIFPKSKVITKGLNIIKLFQI